MPRLVTITALALALVNATANDAFAAGLADPYEAYDKGQWDRALQGFVDLQVEHPDDAHLALHLGSAHFQMKNYAEAEKSFSQAALAGETAVREQALYNLGNTAYRQGKLQDAVEWYRQALELDPNDEDAKFNLEFVRDEIRRRHEEAKKRQEQQQQQQQQQEQQQDPQQQQGDQQEQQQQQGEQEQQQQGEQEQPQGEQGEQEQQQGEQEQQQGEQEQQQGEGQPQPMQARKLSPEEAERFLQGLSEDRKKHLEKKRAKMGRGRRGRPAKDW